MLKTRVFPCLLLKGTGLVKTVQFKNPTYVGDPINAVRIFNTKEVDELVLLDITATEEKRPPQFDLISKISDECRMPLSVGGGVRTIEDIRKLLNGGAEKVVLNTHAIRDPNLIEQAANEMGSQSVIVAIDAKRNSDGQYEVFIEGGNKPSGHDPVALAKLMEEKGAGEIFLNSIDKDGTMSGYDIELIRRVSEAVNIPVIACGGAGKIEDFKEAVQGGAAAVAAGSFFVFHGRRRAVLISFPAKDELENAF